MHCCKKKTMVITMPNGEKGTEAPQTMETKQYLRQFL